jgi:hypothetical protein
LPCNYNHLTSTTNPSASRKKAHRPSTANSGPTASPPPQSPPASSHGAYMGQAPVGAPDGQMHHEGTSLEGDELDLKRKSDDSEPIQQQKRLRTEESPALDSGSVDSSPRGL